MLYNQTSVSSASNSVPPVIAIERYPPVNTQGMTIPTGNSRIGTAARKSSSFSRSAPKSEVSAGPASPVAAPPGPA